MQNVKFKMIGLVAAMSIVVTSLTACKPRNEPVHDETAPKVESVAKSIPTVEAKVVVMDLPKPEVCDAEGCTQYSIQTVKTNIDWIDQYFNDRIKKADPLAFSTEPNQKIALNEDSNAGLSQSTTSVRYLSQFGNIATFAIDSYTYSAGAAHGMYHIEYVNFDLNAKQRLSLKDVIAKGKDAEVLNELYEANSSWLENHVIEKSKFQLSDNFYYGANGIVFVYPLYELASYAEGMSELTLPYRSAKNLFRAEYLPSLPNYEK